MASTHFITIVAGLALSASAGAVDTSTDRAVVAAALDHFAGRTDAHFYDATAKLAIWPRTEKVRGANFGYEYFNQAEGHCSVARPLYDAFLRRNATSRTVGSLLSDSEKWRRVRPSEEKTISPAFPPPPGVERPPIKTLVALTQPAYSEDGARALIVLNFVWSIHGAEARYVLMRSNEKWVVDCSQLVLYV
jgi:hypothetical protein